MRRRVAFIHTSPAAIPPLADFYQANAPDLEITNLLDDGLLRFFARQEEVMAETRLQDMVCTARDAYSSELAMVTCSAVSRALIRRIAEATDLPIVKIDDVLAQQAVEAGVRLGVVVTFPPTHAAISRLLREMAAERDRTVELTIRVLPEAYEALLGGKTERHDQLLLAAVEELGRLPLDAIVLAQVSMARLLNMLPPVPVPVLSSLPASLTAIRAALNSAS
ncbi:MAG: hypothetical protein HY235_29930 [Acidobacteria bacterium]|nr:hypothetical protein [Acidobacteriota bacterium]